MTSYFEDIRIVNEAYQVGAGIEVCKKASLICGSEFGGDPLQALLYIMADGYAISVGNGLPDKERREARLTWNRNRAISESEWLREKYSKIAQS
jgi:hypothetical protein